MGKRKRQSQSESDVHVTDFVSVWQWMGVQLLILLPFINLIAIPTLAFVGSNRSRKNFFRALLLWVALVWGLHLLLFFVFLSPQAADWFWRMWAEVVDLFSLPG